MKPTKMAPKIPCNLARFESQTKHQWSKELVETHLPWMCSPGGANDWSRYEPQKHDNQNLLNMMFSGFWTDLCFSSPVSDLNHTAVLQTEPPQLESFIFNNSCTKEPSEGHHYLGLKLPPWGRSGLDSYYILSCRIWVYILPCWLIAVDFDKHTIPGFCCLLFLNGLQLSKWNHHKRTKDGVTMKTKRDLKETWLTWLTQNYAD